MRQRGRQILVLVGLCWLCFAGSVFAAGRGGGGGRPVAPEIDVGSAAGALTIAAGVLAILRERMRRPSA
jgi:hypothetical protein